VTEWMIEPLGSADDVDGILDVERASFSNPWTREMYLAELANEGTAFFFVARDRDRRIVGFCSFWMVVDELHINNLAVEPGRRREGVGAALLQRVIEDGVQKGATRVTLEVRQSNEEALRLYERFGFRVEGVRRGYYSHPVEDALVLWRVPAKP
jgi:ribosomal-protein-alanine N-acetyltransferase